jgi:hypothetical protein
MFHVILLLFVRLTRLYSLERLQYPSDARRNMAGGLSGSSTTRDTLIMRIPDRTPRWRRWYSIFISDGRPFWSLAEYSTDPFLRSMTVFDFRVRQLDACRLSLLVVTRSLDIFSSSPTTTHFSGSPRCRSCVAVFSSTYNGGPSETLRD